MATSDFGKAFRAAREAGDKEFEFGGKKYNTKLKEEDSAPAKKAAPVKDTSNYSNEGRSSAKDTSNYSNEGRSSAKTESKPEKKTGIGPYNAFSGVGDYLNKTFTREGREEVTKEAKERYGMKKGGAVSASRRADGIAQRGKTRGKMC
jgi:hypothetical protein